MEKEEMKPDVQCCMYLLKGDDLQLNFVSMYLGAAQKGWTPLSFNLGKAILARWKKENKDAGKNYKFFSYVDPTKLKMSVVKIQVALIKEKVVSTENSTIVQMLCKKGLGVSHETKFIGKPIDMDKLILPKRGGTE